MGKSLLPADIVDGIRVKGRQSGSNDNEHTSMFRLFAPFAEYKYI